MTVSYINSWNLNWNKIQLGEYRDRKSVAVCSTAKITDFVTTEKPTEAVNYEWNDSFQSKPTIMLDIN